MKDVISVIVPVYNVSAYLPECLDSILSQDYEKLEVILIDDGSTDDSGTICDLTPSGTAAFGSSTRKTAARRRQKTQDCGRPRGNT